MKLRFLIDGNVMEADVPVKSMLGRSVVTAKPLANGSFMAPMGAKFRIRGTWGSGFTLERTEKCGTCGLHGIISRVHVSDVFIVGRPPTKDES